MLKPSPTWMLLFILAVIIILKCFDAGVPSWTTSIAPPAGVTPATNAESKIWWPPPDDAGRAWEIANDCLTSAYRIVHGGEQPLMERFIVLNAIWRTRYIIYEAAPMAFQRRPTMSFLFYVAVIAGESGGDPSAIGYRRDRAGRLIRDTQGRPIPDDFGLPQLNTVTLTALGIKDWPDPYETAVGGAYWLAGRLRTFGDIRQAVWAYNAGEQSVRIGYMPGRTRDYLAGVLNRYDRMRRLLDAEN